MPTQLPSPDDIIPMKDRRSWRTWLEKHHDRKQSVWILFPKKHTARPSIAYSDAVEEALCFGWIDSQVRRLDEDVYIQKFTPRKRKSAWSPSNKQRVRKLVRLGLMTTAGLAKAAEAKKDGSRTTLDAVEKLEAMWGPQGGDRPQCRRREELPEAQPDAQETVPLVHRERQERRDANKAHRDRHAAPCEEQDHERSFLRERSAMSAGDRWDQALRCRGRR